MTDVFIRVYAANHLRLGMVNLAMTRWLMEPDVKLHLIVREGSMGFEEGVLRGFDVTVIQYQDKFHILSKVIADEKAKSPVYVLADDDQLIIGTDWVSRGCEIYQDHPEFSYLAARSINGEVPDVGHPVWERDSVGTPYFTKKGLITDFPNGDLPETYDTVFSKHCMDKGFKVGFMQNLRFNHLGCGYSTVVQGHWGAPKPPEPTTKSRIQLVQKETID